jgi:tetratricopeptide (TPR) repeat protein
MKSPHSVVGNIRFALSICLLFLPSCALFHEDISPDRSAEVNSFVTKGILYLREYDKGDHEALLRASAAFQIASQIDPDAVSVIDGLGCVALREGRIDSADSFFSKAILLDPSYARAWVHLAYVAELKGKYELSEEYLRRALQLDPFEVHGLNNLAGILHDQSPTGDSRDEVQSLLHRAKELYKGDQDTIKHNISLTK